MKNKYLLRTRFKNEIVAEFLPPTRKSNKVIILCGGMPSFPNNDDLVRFLSTKGYWVFVPRYRGSWESKGLFLQKSPAIDVLDIMNEIEKGFVDLWSGEKHKILKPQFYLIGSSFGGPAVILNSKDKRVKKVVTLSPVTDWMAEAKERENKDDNRNFKKYYNFVEKAFGDGYRPVSGVWDKIRSGKFYNPATDLKKVDGKKIMIFHATGDKVVFFEENAKSFAEKTGTKLVTVKGDEHFGVSAVELPFFWNKISKFFKSK